MGHAIDQIALPNVRTVEINQDVENILVVLSLFEVNIEYGVITQPYINLTYVVHHKVAHPMGFLQI